jgi:hypothetical protein
MTNQTPAVVDILKYPQAFRMKPLLPFQQPEFL